MKIFVLFFLATNAQNLKSLLIDVCFDVIILHI